MSLAQNRDIGSYIDAIEALIPAVITAGAGNDGVEVDGGWRSVMADDIPHSAALLIIWSTTLDAAETLTLTANLQDATDISGTGAADFGPALAATVVATGPTGGGTLVGVTKLDIPEFNGNRGFVQAQITADLSRAGTDTVAIAACIVLGGGQIFPPSFA